jgi:hypothetical protein
VQINKVGDLGFEPRTSGLRVRCATIALVTPGITLAQVYREINSWNEEILSSNRHLQKLL